MRLIFSVMLWYHWISLAALAFCALFLTRHLLRLLRMGAPRDHSAPQGTVGPALKYSLTGAMSPAKKESAYLHLPTYTAGILYHLGTFLGLALFFLAMLKVSLPHAALAASAIFFGLTALSGLGILVKRIAKKGLRDLSLPDDYVSNILVTGMQLLTVLFLLFPASAAIYFTWWALLLIYIPAGKLRHLLYFFAARYQLAFFYGRRGTWPPQNPS